MTIGICTISLCDHLNPGFGYQIKITDDSGKVLLFDNGGENVLTLERAIILLKTHMRPHSTKECVEGCTGECQYMSQANTYRPTK